MLCELCCVSCVVLVVLSCVSCMYAMVSQKHRSDPESLFWHLVIGPSEEKKNVAGGPV